MSFSRHIVKDYLSHKKHNTNDRGYAMPVPIDLRVLLLLHAVPCGNCVDFRTCEGPLCYTTALCHSQGHRHPHERADE